MDLYSVAYILIIAGVIFSIFEYGDGGYGKTPKQVVRITQATLIFGILLGLTGIGIVFFYGTTNQALTATSLFIVGLIIAVPMARYVVRYFRGNQEAIENSTVIDTPEANELAALKGRIGKTVSMLRPSGIADFNGRRVDVITEGLVIEEGQWVKCVEVKAGRVIVRPSDHPPLGDLEKFDFS
ncbi:MAG: NfeD family protein [Zavarzinella sp.]